MATNPPTPDETQKLLQFARDTAKDEIANIERLHDRALLALSIVLLFFVACVGILGWIGYANLRNLAVSVARKQMENTVSQEIANRMNQGAVDKTVKEVMEKRTEADLVATINQRVADEISKRGPAIDRTVQADTTNAVNVMRPKIQEMASTEAKRLVAETFASRHISPQQVDRLKTAGAKYGGRGFAVRIRAISDDPEEKQYAAEIDKALHNAGWLTSLDAPTGGYGGGSIDVPFILGVFLAVEAPQQPPKGTDELKEVLGQAGLIAPIVQGDQLNNVVPDAERRPHPAPTLVVGPRF
jgi:hypothetical protein